MQHLRRFTQGCICCRGLSCLTALFPSFEVSQHRCKTEQVLNSGSETQI